MMMADTTEDIAVMEDMVAGVVTDGLAILVRLQPANQRHSVIGSGGDKAAVRGLL
jgi:hypothetical protein